MDVVMKIEITGLRNGIAWPRPGEGVMSLPEDEARDLIDAGKAEAVEPAKKAAPKAQPKPELEKAVAPKPETRKAR